MISICPACLVEIRTTGHTCAKTLIVQPVVELPPVDQREADILRQVASLVRKLKAVRAIASRLGAQQILDVLDGP